MKVIFLDCDGVLNSGDWIKECWNKWGPNMTRDQRTTQVNCPELYDNLKYIVDNTNAKIVLSSTWRLGFNDDLTPDLKFDNSIRLLEEFSKRGIELVGKTGRDADGNRSKEIKEYLDQHPEVDKFIIIDDDTYDIINYEAVDWRGKPYKGIGLFDDSVFVNTRFKTGLTKEKAEEAIRKLGK